MAIEQTYFSDGQKVLAPDLNAYGSGALDFAGDILASIIASINATVDDTPLQAIAEGLVVSVGGIGQKVFLNKEQRDYNPTVSLAFPAGWGADRTDVIAIAAQDVYGDAFVVDFEALDGSVAPGTGQHVWRGLSIIALQAGTALPVGYTAWAHVVVRAGAQGINQSDITVLFPTIGSLIAQIIGFTGPHVTTINGQYNAVTVDSPNGTVQVWETPGAVHLQVPLQIVVGPKGDKGDKGDPGGQGPQGIPGQDASASSFIIGPYCQVIPAGPTPAVISVYLPNGLWNVRCDVILSVSNIEGILSRVSGSPWLGSTDVVQNVISSGTTAQNNEAGENTCAGLYLTQCAGPQTVSIGIRYVTSGAGNANAGNAAYSTQTGIMTITAFRVF